MPEVYSAVQRDLDGLKGTSCRSTRGILHLEENNPTHQCVLGTDRLESSFAQKDLRVLVDTRLRD